MTGAKSRRKGHDFERAFCRWVRDELGIESFGRNLKQYGTAQEGDTDPLAGTHTNRTETAKRARLERIVRWREKLRSTRWST